MLTVRFTKRKKIMAGHGLMGFVLGMNESKNNYLCLILDVQCKQLQI